MSRISIAQVDTLIEEQFPFAREFGFVLESLDDGRAMVRAPYRSAFLRPGGTIAGPVIMGLADYAVYVALLTRIGMVELAVTTSFNINFLSRPGEADLIANASIIKLGKRLAVGEVEMTSVGADDLVAHVTATYSIPPDAI